MKVVKVKFELITPAFPNKPCVCLIGIKIHGASLFFLLDTGASNTIIDPREKHILKEEIQSIPLHVATQKNDAMRFGLCNTELIIGKIKVSWPCILTDISDILDGLGFIAGRKITGVLGADFLCKHKAILDFKTKKLTLYIP